MKTLLYRANVQYRCGDETVTFNRDQHLYEPFPASSDVVEINGKPAKTGDKIPEWILKYWAHDIAPPVPALEIRA